MLPLTPILLRVEPRAGGNRAYDTETVFTKDLAVRALRKASAERQIRIAADAMYYRCEDALLQYCGDRITLIVYDSHFEMAAPFFDGTPKPETAGPQATLRAAKEWLRITRDLEIPTRVYVCWQVSERFPQEVAAALCEDPARGEVHLNSDDLQTVAPILALVSVVSLYPSVNDVHACCTCAPQGQSPEVTRRARAHRSREIMERTRRNDEASLRLGMTIKCDWRPAKSTGIFLSLSLTGSSWLVPGVRRPSIPCARVVAQGHQERVSALLRNSQSAMTRFLQRDGDHAVLTRVLKFLLPPAWPLDWSEMGEWLNSRGSA